VFIKKQREREERKRKKKKERDRNTKDERSINILHHPCSCPGDTSKQVYNMLSLSHSHLHHSLLQETEMFNNK
jgi:hypothetical protein